MKQIKTFKTNAEIKIPVTIEGNAFRLMKSKEGALKITNTNPKNRKKMGIHLFSLPDSNAVYMRYLISLLKEGDEIFLIIPEEKHDKNVDD